MSQFLTWQLPGGELRYCPSYLSAEQRQTLLQRLITELRWQQPEIRLFGKAVAIPRQQVWMGDADATYRYSGTTFDAEPWHPLVAALGQQLNRDCGVVFNSVLLNLYRNGQDHMGWHSDDEPELGDRPLIASLSLGATRRFLLAHKQLACKLELSLGAGDLLIMQGDSQKFWKHAIAKEARVDQPRINLTFRSILTAQRIGSQL